MDELTSSQAPPRFLRRFRWAAIAGLAVIAVAVASVALVMILHRQPAPHPAAVAPVAPAVAPAAALGGSGDGRSQWFHLDAGTYQISLKADNGQPFTDQAFLRHRVAGPSADGSYTNAQAPIVAFAHEGGAVKNDVETLPAGDYVLVVAGLDSQGWTLTVTRMP